MSVSVVGICFVNMVASLTWVCRRHGCRLNAAVESTRLTPSSSTPLVQADDYDEYDLGDNAPDVFSLIQESYTKTTAQGSRGFRVVGPLLRLSAYDVTSHTWRGTVLLVLDSSLGKPLLTYRIDGGGPVEVQSLWLDTFGSFNFFRWGGFQGGVCVEVVGCIQM